MIYLSVFIDLYSRKCVGYSIREQMKEDLVIDSLTEAIQKEKPKAGLIIHTNQGAQYTGSSFHEYIQINN